MQQAPPEAERILANDYKVDQLQDCELVQEDPGDNGNNEESELRHDHRQFIHAQDLCANDTSDSDRRDPGRGTAWQSLTLMDPEPEVELTT